MARLTDFGPSEGEQWLRTRVRGFRDLDEADLRVIYDFTLLWSLFEAEVMDTSATSRKIAERIDAWIEGGTFDVGSYEPELAYFSDRYFSGDMLSERFEHLNLRKADFPNTVREVIEGIEKRPRERVLALLIIVMRLRNNLFHGTKWAYGLQDQRANFEHANRVLMRLLEQHGGM